MGAVKTKHTKKGDGGSTGDQPGDLARMNWHESETQAGSKKCAGSLDTWHRVRLPQLWDTQCSCCTAGSQSYQVCMGMIQLVATGCGPRPLPAACSDMHGTRAVNQEGVLLRKAASVMASGVLTCPAPGLPQAGRSVGRLAAPWSRRAAVDQLLVAAHPQVNLLPHGTGSAGHMHSIAAHWRACHECMGP